MFTSVKTNRYTIALMIMCAVTSTKLSADPNQDPIQSDQIDLAEYHLVQTIIDMVEQMKDGSFSEDVTEAFARCYENIMAGNTLMPIDELTKIVPYVLDYALTTETDRAPRPENVDAANAFVGNVNCDLVPVLSLLAAIKFRIGSVKDSSCCNTVLGILGDACEILGPDGTISGTLKDIEEKICCEIAIKQDDIPLIIDTPGIYCLAESITFGNTSTAITIVAPDVSLCLCGKVIDGGTDGGTCILVNDTANVKIKNGTLRGAEGVNIRNSSCVTVENIKTVLNRNNGILATFSSDIFIDACHTFTTLECGFLLEDCNNIQVTNSSTAYNDISGQVVSQDGFGFVRSVNIVAKNLVSTNHENHGIETTTSSNVAFENIVCQQNGNAGMRFSLGSNNIAITNLTTQNNGAIGLFFASTENISACKVVSESNNQSGIRCNGAMQIELQNCSALNNNVDGISLENVTSGIINKCTAQGNTMMGVDIIDSSTQIVICDTIADSNSSDGFKISGGNVLVQDCKAASNGSDGFFIDGDVIQVISNRAHANSGFGFDDSGSNTTFANNLATENNAGEYSGVANTILLSGDQDIGYWANTRS